MKKLEEFVIEKLKVSTNDYQCKCENDFEYLFKTITDICKSRVKDKKDFINFGYDLFSYFITCCKAKSEEYHTLHEVNSRKNDYNDHSMYFIQHHDICEFGLHYDNVSYYFSYKYSKFKIEKFEDVGFSYYCKYKGGGLYESRIIEFPEKLIIDFANNIDNNF